MNVGVVQRAIDRSWLASGQRWCLGAAAVVAATAAETFTAAAAGQQVAVLLVLVVGLAIVAACSPDSHTALVLEVIIVWHWLAATDHVVSAWSIPVAVSLHVFHTLVAMLAATPITATVERSILFRWTRRCLTVACATVAMWFLAFALHERRAPGNALVTFVGFVTLTTLVLATRGRSDSTGPPAVQG